MMMEDIYNEIMDAYEKYKQMHHSNCTKIFKQKDGSMQCKDINEIEEWTSDFYGNKKHDFLKGLASADDKIKYYEREIDLIQSKFIDDIHIQEMNIIIRKKDEEKKEVRVYKTEIHRFVSGLIDNDLDSTLKVLLCYGIADLRFYSYLKNNPPTDNRKYNTPRMEWKGTQKQLAELFVELQKKGWIEKIESNTIEQSFTNTKSIKQYLKPFVDKSQGYKSTYEKLYSKEYSPQFTSIKENVTH